MNAVNLVSMVILVTVIQDGLVPIVIFKSDVRPQIKKIMINQRNIKAKREIPKINQTLIILFTSIF